MSVKNMRLPGLPGKRSARRLALPGLVLGLAGLLGGCYYNPYYPYYGYPYGGYGYPYGGYGYYGYPAVYAAAPVAVGIGFGFGGYYGGYRHGYFHR